MWSDAFQAGVPLAQVLAMAPIDGTPEAERQSVDVITRTTGALGHRWFADGENGTC